MSRPTYVHLCARVVHAPLPLHHPLVAPIVWRALRRQFPVVGAVELMPYHTHVFAREEDEAIARRKLAFVTRGLARCRGPVGEIEWAKATAKGIFPPGLKAARQVRYIDLNSCRKGLVHDPLAWAWSTHRDVMGAVVDPWVTVETLAAICDRPVRGFREWYHEYVCGDPHVDPSALRLPVPVASGGEATLPLAQVRDAALSCTRSAPDGLEQRGVARRVFLQLAGDQGWRDARALAATCKITPRSVWYARNGWQERDDGLLLPARLCLGDERLREGLVLAEEMPRKHWRAP